MNRKEIDNSLRVYRKLLVESIDRNKAAIEKYKAEGKQQQAWMREDMNEGFETSLTWFDNLFKDIKSD